METKFYMGPDWKHSGRPYEPVTNHKILKNVLVASENSKDRYHLMLDLLEQMEERLPPFSALYINLDPNVECPETFDAKIPYGSSKFSVPYYLKSSDRLYDDFNKCFTAILNFHPELRIIMGLIYQNCEKKEFPTSIIEFLDLMRTLLQDHPYDAEFNGSLLKNIKDARDLFENDSTLEHALRIGVKTPEWVALWKQKQKIWIDLSCCKPRIQKMLVPVIFLNLLRFTEHRGLAEMYWHLHGVVVINEADNVFASVPWERYRAHFKQRKEYWNTLLDKSIFLNPWVMLTKEQIVEAHGDSLYLFKSRLERYYRDLLYDEFRLRNITLFTGTADEKTVHNFISSLSQVKFVPAENLTENQFFSL